MSAAEVGKVGVEGNAYVPLSAMQSKTKAEVERLYNSNISYFDANCVKNSANCNSVVDNMLKFADSDYVSLHYPSLRDRTIRLLRDNPQVVERYFNNKVAQFNVKDRSILNMYLLPALEVAGGVAGVGGSVAGATYACAQTAGFGCYAAAVAGSAGFASSIDHIATGSSNIGKPLSQQDPTAFVKFLKSQGLSGATASNLQFVIDVFGTGGVGRAVSSTTGLQGAISGKPIIASGNSVQKIIFNGIELHPSLPPPIAGYNYQPRKLNGKTTAQQNAHINGYRAEIEQANRVANMPNEQVIKWGDKIGNHGADIISVNRITGGVTLWDSKYRSATTNINTSPTFTNPSALRSAKNEAIKAIKGSNLPQSTKNLAISNIVNNNISFKTTGAGNARNSVID